MLSGVHAERTITFKGFSETFLALFSGKGKTPACQRKWFSGELSNFETKKGLAPRSSDVGNLQSRGLFQFFSHFTFAKKLN